MFFIVEFVDTEWNVGDWGGYDLTWKGVDVQIMSIDCMALLVALDGSTTGTISVSTVDHISMVGNGEFRVTTQLLHSSLQFYVVAIQLFLLPRG